MKTIMLLALLLFPAYGFSLEPGSIRALEGLDLSGAEVPAAGLPAPAGDKFMRFDPAQRPASLAAETADGYSVSGIRSGLLPGSAEDYAWDTMRIRPALVSEAYWGYESGGVGHSFLVVSFARGGVADASGRDVSALVFSAEAWYLKGEPYKPFTLGVRDHYPLIWVLASWDSFAEYELRNNTRELTVFPLKLDAGQKESLLRIAVREGVKDRAGEYYHTFRKSCTNMPMSILGESLGREFRFFKTLPAAGVEHLKLEKLIGTGARLTRSDWQGYDIRTATPAGEGK